MAGSIATAVTVWIWNSRTDYHHAVLTEHVRDSTAGWLDYHAHLDGLGISCILVAMMPIIWFAKPPFTFKRGEGGHWSARPSPLRIPQGAAP